jgi:Cof subfamily protein (haloacid dehalogenase superfamily)
LIVCDLDGTLLNSKREISGRTLKAIARYHEAGGIFTFATGRTEESARVFAEQAGITAPGVSFNGGKVVSLSGGRVIYESFLAAEPAINAYMAIRKINKDIIVYFDKYRYVAEYTDVIDKYVNRIRHGVHIIDDIKKVIGDGSGLKKLLVIDPKQEENLILNAVRPAFGDNLNYVKSDPEYFEFMPPGTSKGRALTILAAYLGVAPGETVAIGDHLNDIPMLISAGLGVAMANAEPETLEAADYITASNDEDGVALILEKILNRAL